jgi:hypothetical protein
LSTPCKVTYCITKSPDNALVQKISPRPELFISCNESDYYTRFYTNGCQSHLSIPRASTFSARNLISPRMCFLQSSLATFPSFFTHRLVVGLNTFPVCSCLLEILFDGPASSLAWGACRVFDIFELTEERLELMDEVELMIPFLDDFSEEVLTEGDRLVALFCEDVAFADSLLDECDDESLVEESFEDLDVSIEDDRRPTNNFCGDFALYHELSYRALYMLESRFTRSDNPLILAIFSSLGDEPKIFSD